MKWTSALIFSGIVTCAPAFLGAQVATRTIAPQAAPALADRKPNIIFILADDLGYGDLGCYGQRLIHTPHIDSLAAVGMRFTDFYAGSSVCAPSRSSLMTGQHTGHTPIRGNKEIEPEGQFPISGKAILIPEILKNAGYRTGDFGKWGLGFVGTEGDPVKKGFDVFYGYNCQRQSHSYFPDHLWDNDKRVDLPNTAADHRVYAADLIRDKALQFIDDNKANPFFLYFSCTLPHAALQLPAEDSLLEAYKKEFNEQAVPPRDIKETDPGGYQYQPYPRAAYAAMVTRLDNYVGEIVRKVKALGLEKNTLILFSSDNGPHREGGNDPEFFNSSGGFRGIKRDLYEGGIRVPLIVCWPGVVSPHSVAHHTGAFWDILPSLAELSGQKIPDGVDGLSLLPVFTGLPAGKTGAGKTGAGQAGKDTFRTHEYLYWEFHENGGRQAVRMGKWKGIRLNVIRDGNSPLELYDLTADPNERHDLAAEYPGIVARLLRIMKEQHVENASFPFIITNGVRSYTRP